jgi:antirestriction protein ArdC
MFGVNSVYDNQAAYVQSWMKAIKDDPNILGISASEAQKVVDYLLGMDLGDWSPVDGYSIGSKSSKDEE